MRQLTITLKNSRTGKPEKIQTSGFEKLGWGFSFLVDTELDAFKAAYQYRNSKHGVETKGAPGAEKWKVTVFNESAVESGIAPVIAR